MHSLVLVKNSLKDFIRSVKSSGMKIFGPVKKAESVELLELNGDEDLSFDYSNFTLSAKSFFLPQCETLCEFTDEKLAAVPFAEGKSLLTGIRPCDANAIVSLDKIFGVSSKTPDPFFVQRRENTVVMSFACNEPRVTCFCTSVGGSPSSKLGSDILAFDLGDKILLETCSEKGNEFLNAYGQQLANAEGQDLQQKEKISSEAAHKMQTFDVSGLKDKLEGLFDSPLWAGICETCLGCGVCTYLCPTCHCFDITDETGRSKGRRIRTWDSCQYALFTHHTSGHNPRPAKKHRMRQRVMHKFLYTVQNNGSIFCVGCGRCVRHCPVNLDIREILAKIKNEN